MRPRLTPLEDWEQAALRTDAQSGAEASMQAAEWYALALHLRVACVRLRDKTVRTLPSARRPLAAPVYILPPPDALPIENRLYALFSE